MSAGTSSGRTLLTGVKYGVSLECSEAEESSSEAEVDAGSQGEGSIKIISCVSRLEWYTDASPVYIRVSHGVTCVGDYGHGQERFARLDHHRRRRGFHCRRSGERYFVAGEVIVVGVVEAQWLEEWVAPVRLSVDRWMRTNA
jgi:hypothetical protein